MGGGCGGLSLLGLLVGVGLTVWIASMVVGGSSGGDQPERRDAAGLAEVLDPTTTVPASAALSVAPASDLTDGAVVTITSDDFPAGAQVRVERCLARSGAVTGDTSPCDPAGVALDSVDARGHLVARLAVSRVVEVGGVPFDCASEPPRCTVRVTAVAEPARSGSALITFRSEDDRPQITLPD